MRLMLTLRDITAQRLRNQCLSQSSFTQPQEVVQRLGAMQAQDYAGAKWAIAQRATGLTDAALDQALMDGTILRTHVLRPTWHFVTPADIRWMLELTAPRVNAFNAYQYRKYELNDAIFKRSNAALAKALRGGQQLTRNELAAVLTRAKINVEDGVRLVHLVMHAELDAVVCSGGRRGKQFTYTLLDERAPAGPAFTRDVALAELTRRYLHSRGPATPADFAWWSGLTLTDARRGFAAVQSEFVQDTLDGETYWFPPVSPMKSSSSPSAHWLATYDEYLIGYKDRSAAVRPEYAQQIIGGEVFTSTCLLDGNVVGVWKRTALKNEAIIEVKYFVAPKPSERKALVQAIKGFGAFLGLPVRLEEISST